MNERSHHLLICDVCEATYCQRCSDGDPSWRYCSDACTRRAYIDKAVDNDRIG